MLVNLLSNWATYLLDQELLYLTFHLFSGSQDLRAPEERMLHSIHPSIVETLPETFPDLKHEFSKLVSQLLRFKTSLRQWNSTKRVNLHNRSRNWKLAPAFMICTIARQSIFSDPLELCHSYIFKLKWASRLSDKACLLTDKILEEEYKGILKGIQHFSLKVYQWQSPDDWKKTT